MSDESFDLVIVGGGPAGLTAGIYAARSGLSAVIIDEGMCGGLAATSPWIENYPGFEGISGMDLMQKMKEHAEKNLPINEGVHIDSIEMSDDGFVLKAGDTIIQGSAIILATGAKYRHLGVPGEEELAGMGVSYCATCDGFFFRGKKVIVVGGGNNAAVEAIHLKSVGAEVSLIHRRDSLRAEGALQEHMEKEGIDQMLSTELLAIEGTDKVERVRLKDNITDETRTMAIEGVFISVGEIPNTELAKLLDVELAAEGNIQTDRTQRTNVRNAYAAGDVTGGLRQIITACAEGATAAMSAFEDIKTPYWASR